ncbi:MAG: hypothetical protein ACOCQ2_02720 [Halanaerobiales bacterium]
MEPYVMAKDLYKFKLALILGRGKRLKRVLREYPTERKFKQASVQELAGVVGIKNSDSRILQKLKKLDSTYDKMVTFKAAPYWSKDPMAKTIMGIDTEYLKSNLDCLQYVIVKELNPVNSGIIFTNSRLCPSVNVEDGINILRDIINEYEPDLIVGHNFNSDISIMERAYGFTLPELYHFDDTMELMKQSNLANIIGGFALNKVVKELFNEETVGLFSAYQNLSLLMEYGIKDALYPVFLRYFIMHGDLPELDFNLKIDTIVKPQNRKKLSNDSLQFSF